MPGSCASRSDQAGSVRGGVGAFGYAGANRFEPSAWSRLRRIASGNRRIRTYSYSSLSASTWTRPCCKRTPANRRSGSKTNAQSLTPRAYARYDRPPCPNGTVRSPAMRLVVARCEVLYTGRLTATLPEAVRLIMFKADGSVLVHDDSGSYKPLNWMTPPTVIDEEGDRIVVRRRAGNSEDRLEIRLAEIL